MKDIAAFFDLDKTVLVTSSSMALRKAFIEKGLTSRRKTFLSVLIQLEYIIFGAGHKKLEKISNRIAALSKGINVVALEEVTEQSFDEFIYPKCNKQILTLLDSHKDLGHKTILASASSVPMVRPIASKLGIDYYLGTEIEVKNDIFQGEIITFMYADEKADHAKKLAEKHGWDLAKSYAYSDSITDLPLLELVGNPIAVNPDKKLKKVALEKGWKILELNKDDRKSKYLKRINSGVKILFPIFVLGILVNIFNRKKNKKF